MTVAKRFLTVAVVVGALRCAVRATATEWPERTGIPYLGAIVVETETGEVLFEDHADTYGYPASVIKLLTMLVVLEAVESGRISLQDSITISAKASQIGGSQVYLKEGEQFTVDELLYALMVQSANDAACALAEHVAGNRSVFVSRMQAIAWRLGMTNTVIHTEHGLPPGPGQQADITTARDLAKLCCALSTRPEVFRYTRTTERPFRNGTFIMRNHNPLLKTFPECDGFKTGYYRKAGYSIAATAQKYGANRIAVVILGSKDRELRNRTAEQLLQHGFRILAQRRRERYLQPNAGRPPAAINIVAAPQGVSDRASP